MITPTTLEMDGIFTQEDADNRFDVMMRCLECREWHRINGYLNKRTYRKCSCGGVFDMRSAKSIRTFDPSIDGKKKIR